MTTPVKIPFPPPVAGNPALQIWVEQIWRVMIGLVNESQFTLADLTDTTISSPADGEYLCYNGTIWVNSTIPSSDVTYDPTVSGLMATDVKAALDELAALHTVSATDNAIGGASGADTARHMLIWRI